MLTAASFINERKSVGRAGRTFLPRNNTEKFVQQPPDELSHPRAGVGVSSANLRTNFLSPAGSAERRIFIRGARVAAAPTPPRAMGATRSQTAVIKDPPGAPSASRKRGQVRPHYRSNTHAHALLDARNACKRKTSSSVCSSHKCCFTPSSRPASAAAGPGARSEPAGNARPRFKRSAPF
jgi:hypothetical protein